jgi:hypothetical protein
VAQRGGKGDFPKGLLSRARVGCSTNGAQPAHLCVVGAPTRGWEREFSVNLTLLMIVAILGSVAPNSTQDATRGWQREEHQRPCVCLGWRVVVSAPSHRYVHLRAAAELKYAVCGKELTAGSPMWLRRALPTP